MTRSVPARSRRWTTQGLATAVVSTRSSGAVTTVGRISRRGSEARMCRSARQRPPNSAPPASASESGDPPAPPPSSPALARPPWFPADQATTPNAPFGACRKVLRRVHRLDAQRQRRSPPGWRAAACTRSCAFAARQVARSRRASRWQLRFFMDLPGRCPHACLAAVASAESRSPGLPPSTTAPPGTGPDDDPAHVGLRVDLQPHRAARRRAPASSLLLDRADAA